MKKLLTLSLLTTTLFAQDFERVKPKEPTEFQGEQGITYPSTQESYQVPNGNALIIPELKGIILTDKKRHITDEETARSAVHAFLTTDFEGGRHQARVEQLAALDKGESV